MATNISVFTFNGFQENTYVLDDGSNCVIIDPGCYEPHEQEALVEFIESKNLKPVALLMTHSHIDHVLGAHFVLNKFNIPFYMHELDVQTMQSVASYAHVYGFPGYTPPSDPTHLLKGGEILEFGSIRLEVLFTPGHAPGHVVYFDRENQFVINGDVLFSGSFGRVDLPGGSMEVLKQTIHNVMFTLPDETTVHCGHGPATTIGREKQSNMILQF